jgi:hypothetical protein
MPLDDVITSPTVDILANKFNLGDHATLLSLYIGMSNCEILTVGFVREVQVIASLEVYIADALNPETKTATSNESSGDQTISFKATGRNLSTTSQSIPFEEVSIVLLEVLIPLKKFNSATQKFFFLNSSRDFFFTPS